jgi:hypothetical protein
MSETTKLFLFWAPRLLTVLFALFLSIFALDVFDQNRGFWYTTGALLMHLIPTVTILLLLALAWRWEVVGAFAFTCLGIFYIGAAWGRFHWSVYITISGPLFLIGILFLINWLYRDEIRIRA